MTAFDIVVLTDVVQLDHLQKESERLTDEKPEEAAVIGEKVVTLTELWQELKQTVWVKYTL